VSAKLEVNSILGPTVLDEIILPEVVPVELMTCLSKD
tara:strand:+ start:3534 stop:3644 length:111 start_codon:yes stop_codon:yes gene_type:complete